MTTPVTRYMEFFQQLSPQSLSLIDELFAPQALFQDPFNRVRGPAAIKRIFADMLEQFPDTRFTVRECVGEQSPVYLRWLFQPNPSKTLRIDGVSRVSFDAQGRVTEHCDYWDSASQLFAQLPAIGPPTRWLLRRLRTCATDQTPL